MSDIERVTFAPVRHHSPACALAVATLAATLKPVAILIEGPFDFNPQMDQLALPHRLPIAIYTYVREPDRPTRGAYYPFCEYSPEWQALAAAKALGVPARFIDMPWAVQGRDEPKDSDDDDSSINAFADGQLRRSEYIAALCKEMGVDNFDALWDELFEVDPVDSHRAFLDRVGLFCSHSRKTEPPSSSDLAREAFMAAQIQAVLNETDGPLLVVTGGYHVDGLKERLQAPSLDELDIPELPRDCSAGISLTPYSYERLDRLRGYQSGMPGPGFYDTVWRCRTHNETMAHRQVIGDVIDALRQKKQQVSTADAIAVEIQTRTLAAIRGHTEVWRRDIVDGLRGALIKDEIARGGYHPLLDAVDEVFRGTARGFLAKESNRPPLVADIDEQLATLDLAPNQGMRDVDLDLEDAPSRARSQVLHQLAILEIAGFRRTDGTDMATRVDLHRIFETWRISWNPEFESSRIEAAMYGPTLAAAGSERLKSDITALGSDLAGISRLLIRAALAGLGGHAGDLMIRASKEAAKCEDFLVTVEALRHLLYLYAYDRVLLFAQKEQLLPVIDTLYERSLWLLESLGQPGEKVHVYADGVAALSRVFEQCGEAAAWNEHEFVTVLSRVQRDPDQHPLIRGAATGALWQLGEVDAEPIVDSLTYFSGPDQLGDFLIGLFTLAREAVQRQPALLETLDCVLMAYSDEDFLEALPAMRLAFTFFTPREKFYLASNLLKGASTDETWENLTVSPEAAARAMGLEAEMTAQAERYGIQLSNGETNDR